MALPLTGSLLIGWCHTQKQGYVTYPVPLVVSGHDLIQTARGLPVGLPQPYYSSRVTVAALPEPCFCVCVVVLCTGSPAGGTTLAVVLVLVLFHWHWQSFTGKFVKLYRTVSINLNHANFIFKLK